MIWFVILENLIRGVTCAARFMWITTEINKESCTSLESEIGLYPAL